MRPDDAYLLDMLLPPVWWAPYWNRVCPKTRLHFRIL